MKRDLIKPFDYLKGSEFTKQLKLLTGCEDFLELGQLLDIPKSTFSTWNSHERTSHELMVRLHLALGIPIEKLALKPEDWCDIAELGVNEVSRHYVTTKPKTSDDNQQSQTVIIGSYCLSNGNLIPTGSIPYALRIFNSWNLVDREVIEIETNDGRFLIDKNNTNAVSGTYLIDMDGNLSLNRIQRLPGKRLAIVFDDSTVEVAEEDIIIVGRVAVTLKKD